MEIGEEVVLPVGILTDDGRYRTVTISRMTGYDDENLAKKSIANNGAAAITVILRRCIQAIDGLVERKRNEFDLISAKYVREMMSQVDRDFLLLAIKGLDDPDAVIPSAKDCPECGTRVEVDKPLADLEIYEWPEDEPMQEVLHFDRPFRVQGKECSSLLWAFPTGKTQEDIVRQAAHAKLTSMLSGSVKEFYPIDGSDPILADSETLRRLPTSVRSEIIIAAQNATPGVNLEVEFCCENCGEEFTGMVDVSALFNTGKRATQQTSNAGRGKRRLRKKR